MLYDVCLRMHTYHSSIRTQARRSLLTCSLHFIFRDCSMTLTSNDLIWYAEAHAETFKLIGNCFAAAAVSRALPAENTHQIILCSKDVLFTHDILRYVIARH